MYTNYGKSKIGPGTIIADNVILGYPSRAELCEAGSFDPDKLQDFLRLRRSVRRYKKKPIPREVVEKLVEAARYAPTGANVQSLEHIIIQNRKTIDILAGLCIEEYRKDLEIAQDEEKLAGLDPEQSEELKARNEELEVYANLYKSNGSRWEKELKDFCRGQI